MILAPIVSLVLGGWAALCVLALLVLIRRRHYEIVPTAGEYIPMLIAMIMMAVFRLMVYGRWFDLPTSFYAAFSRYVDIWFLFGVTALAWRSLFYFAVRGTAKGKEVVTRWIRNFSAR